MIHLNCRTSYSFMRGYGDVAEWNARAEAIGAQYAVADYCSTWGHILFAGSAGLGVQLPIVSVLGKEPAHSLGTILAHDQEGLEALYQLVTLAQEQMYYRPRVTWEQVKEHMEGHGSLIIDVINPIELTRWEQVGFGVLGVGGSASTFLNAAAKEFPSVIAPGAQYPSSNDRKAFEAVRAAGRNHRQGEYDGSGTHMLSRADMDVVLRSLDLNVEALWDATTELAAQVQNVRPPQAQLIEPVGLPSLHAMLEEGVKSRFGGLREMPKGYGERLAHELRIIGDKNFEDYFRFVADVVAWSKRRFLVGPGRGSSSGSLVCWLLGITDVDPLVHGTMFARFIDPGRADLPDIDVDFPDVRRDEVFQYLRNKYGADRVAKLGTISRWHAASAINDVARVGEIDRDDARKLKERAEGLPISLAALCSTDDDANAIAKRNPAVGIACDMEGKPRHSGVHAAGIVLASTPLAKFGVVDSKGILSLDLEGAEKVGLLKFDALGLRTLAVIQDCLELAGLEPVDYHNILSEIDETALVAGGNAKLWKLFQEDRVTGIFQFEGHAVRELAKKVTVDQFSDLCALTSLARPGPLYSGQADKWCAMRNGEIEPEYVSDALIDATQDTYGQIIYQEQAMELTRVLAGFDDVMVNKFRKAMGKKVPEDMAKMRTAFVEGCDELEVVKPHESEAIFDMLEEYSGYAFNLSHAVAYSMLTYVCAWLKAEHPMEFVCAQLRSQDDDKKTKALLRDLNAEGYQYVPFDLEKSQEKWSIIDGKVYGGFTAVRGIGPRTAATCIERREADPVGWTETLTAPQRNRLLSPYNTPWHDLTRLTETYGHLYKEPHLANVRKGGILQLDDIPEIKGSYCFIGKLTKAVKREKADAGKDNWFINLYFEDDSGDCGCTINRFKAAGFQYLLEEDALEKDYLVRADIINDGRKWFFLSKLKELPL
jgi:DNA polymerase III alpha subunit